VVVAENGLSNRFGDEFTARRRRAVTVERIGKPDVRMVERDVRMWIAGLDVDRMLSEECRDEPHTDARDGFAVRPVDGFCASLLRPSGKAAQAASAR